MITSHELPYTEIIKSEGDFFSADVTLPVQGAIFQYSKTGFIPGSEVATNFLYSVHPENTKWKSV